MAEAAPIGDIFITVTGNRDVLRPEHFRVMRDGALLANSGHFDVEIDLVGLAKLADGERRRAVRPLVEEFLVPGEGGIDRRVQVIAEGRLVNLSAAEGHPAAVMDMSFANQALSVEWLVGAAERLEPRVYGVPEEIDALVAELKLASLGVEIDVLTPEQEEYLSSWQVGTK